MKTALLFLLSALSLSAQAGAGLKLGGTLLNGKDGTRAIVELGDGRTTQVCEAGKACSKNACDCEVAGYRVIRIEARKATLQRGNERFTLTLDGLRPEGQSGKYARTFAHDFPRGKIHETMAIRGNKAREVMQQLFGSLDLRQTDVLRTVQGLPVPDVVKWGTVYGGISGADEILIEIEREGKLVLFQLRLK